MVNDALQRYKIPQNIHYMTRITIDKHVLDNNKKQNGKTPSY